MKHTLLDDFGQSVYDGAKQQLEQIGQWDEVYCYLLEAYAFSVQEADKIADRLLKEGPVIEYTNKRGKTGEIVSPWVFIYQNYRSQALNLAKEFGLTMVSRKKLPKAKEARLSPRERFKIS